MVLYLRLRNIPGPDSQRTYAALIDCGSSESRIYIYYWFPSPQPGVLPDVVRMRDGHNAVIAIKNHKPLSSFEDNPEAAVAYIASIVEASYMYIPEHKHSKTLLYILATAGMRLLPYHKANALLVALRKGLSGSIKYQVRNIEVIPGRLEGAFMWIALNYILRRFQDSCGNTHGSFEIGGGSMQIAFEVQENTDTAATFSYICPIDNRKVTHHIFSVTFLGLGTNSAYKHYSNRLFSPKKSQDELEHQPDPCLPRNCVVSDTSGSKQGTGSIEECYRRVNRIFDEYLKHKDNLNNYAMFQRIYKTNCDRYNSTFYGLSELWYAFNDFLHYSGPLLPSFYWNDNKEFCNKDCTSLKANLEKGLYVSKEDKYLIDKFLPPGKSHPVTSLQSYNGELIEWTYGAILYYIAKNNI